MFVAAFIGIDLLRNGWAGFCSSGTGWGAKSGIVVRFIAL